MSNPNVLHTVTAEALTAVSTTAAAMFDRIPGGFAQMTAQSIRGIAANAASATERADAYVSITEIVRSMHGDRDRTELDAVLRAHGIEA